MIKTLKFKLQTISPVQISSGEDIDPFSYIIKADRNGNKKLYYIHLYSFISLLKEEDRETLSQLLNDNMANNAICNAIKFICDIFDEEQHKKAVYISYIVSNKLYDEYNEKLKQENIANFKINTNIKDGNYIPYIPGSSIKGMIKRAFIFKQDINRYSDEFKKLQEKEKAEKDPFKMLKISDSYSKNITLNIGYVRDFSLNTLDVQNKYINIVGEFIQQGAVFDVDTVVNTNFNTKNMFKVDIFQSEFGNENRVVSFLNNYFKKLLEREINLFSENGKNKSNKFIQMYDSIKKQYGDKVAFINIGKYGGKLVKVNKENDKSIYARRYYTDIIEKQSKYICSQVMPIGWVALYYE